MNIRLNVFGQSPTGHRRKRLQYIAITGLSGLVYKDGNLAGGLEDTGKYGIMTATINRGPARAKRMIVCGNAFRALRRIVEHYRPC